MSPLRIPAFLTLLLLCGTAFPSRGDITLVAPKDAKKEKPLPVPPQPVPVRVQVPLGGSVDIPLGIVGGTNQRMTFRVRTQPEAGTLSEPKLAGRGAGIVTYRPTAATEQTHDHFSYAVQTEEGVSSAAEVSIVIVDEPPRLQVADELNLGTLLLGTTGRREFTLKNAGGGKLKGSLSVPPPWKLEGDPEYALRAGETQLVAVTISPQEEQSYDGALRYSSNPDRLTALHVQGEAWIAVTPRELGLQPADELTRQGVITLTSRSDEDQVVRIRPGKALEGMGEVALPARGTASLTVRSAPGQLGLAEDALLLEAAGFVMKVPVHVPAAGAVIRCLPMTVALGKIAGDQAQSIMLQLSNTGGTRAPLRIEAAEPLHVEEAEADLSLDAGAQRMVNIAVGPLEAGVFRGALRVKFPRGELVIPVEAEATIGRSKASAPRAALAMHKRIVEGGAAPAAPGAPQILRPFGVQLGRVSSTNCECEWIAPAARTLHYEVQSFVSTGDGAQLKEEWLPLTEVSFGPGGGTAITGESLVRHGLALHEGELASSAPAETPSAEERATMRAVIGGLTPRTSYRLRIVAFERNGLASFASLPVDLHTAMHIPWRRGLEIGIAAIVLLWIAARLRQRQQVTKAEPRAAPVIPIPEPVIAPIAEAKPAPALATASTAKRGPTMREIGPGRFEIIYEPKP